jgi:hypothetical protein
MISFIQLSYRKPARTRSDEGLKPWAVALVLGLILLLQVGLVVWLYLKPAAG